jgi:4-hydroxy-4-methyl-2-oxoglutarate aldolase
VVLFTFTVVFAGLPISSFSKSNHKAKVNCIFPYHGRDQNLVYNPEAIYGLGAKEPSMSITVKPRPADTLSPEEVARWREIPVAVIVDVSNGACQIDPAIRPLCPPGSQPPLFGRAVTVRCEPPHLGGIVYAVDQLQPGDVLVIAANGNTSSAMMGEVVGGHVRRLGGKGIVCDGAVRDVANLATWSDLSVFARAINPRGPTSLEQGEVNIPVVIGGRLVNPGDLVIGDDNGLAVLNPSEVRELIAAAEAKVALEETWIANLTEGRSAVETFGLSPKGEVP